MTLFVTLLPWLQKFCFVDISVMMPDRPIVTIIDR